MIYSIFLIKILKKLLLLNSLPISDLKDLIVMFEKIKNFHYTKMINLLKISLSFSENVIHPYFEWSSRIDKKYTCYY